MAIDMSHRPPPERREAIARAGLASLLAVASADGPTSRRARSFITAVRDHLLQVDIDLAASDGRERILGIESPEKWGFRELEKLWLP